MSNHLSMKKSIFNYVTVVMVISLFSWEMVYASTTSGLKTRRISMISYKNAVLLDVAGPLSVFSAANLFVAKEKKTDKKAYDIEILAEKKGPVRMHSGMTILADNSFLTASHDIDTLMIAGGPGIQEASENKQLIQYLKKMNSKVRRLASICGGSFILAKAGLLKGKKATTHWDHTNALMESYPEVKVQTDINFIRDGHIYTSGGVMNGVQLALALVEEDHGRDIALKVAKLIEVTFEH